MSQLLQELLRRLRRLHTPHLVVHYSLLSPLMSPDLSTVILELSLLVFLMVDCSVCPGCETSPNSARQ